VREPDNEFIVPLTDLRRKLRAPRRVQVRACIPQLTVSDTMVDESTLIDVDLIIEAVPDGVTAVGRVSSRWRGACHLCLDDVFGDVTAEVHEMFSDVPGGDDVYPLGRESLDLRPMITDALLLELPLLARCPFGGVGVCEKAPDLDDEGLEDASGEAESPEIASGAHPSSDPRWAALDGLSFEESSTSTEENQESTEDR
jgi:uncharacterized protein